MGLSVGSGGRVGPSDALGGLEMRLVDVGCILDVVCCRACRGFRWRWPLLSLLVDMSVMSGAGVISEEISGALLIKSGSSTLSSDTLEVILAHDCSITFFLEFRLEILGLLGDFEGGAFWGLFEGLL